MIIPTTEIQNNFGKYLKIAEYEDVIITKNGRKIVKLTQYNQENDRYLLREAPAGYTAANAKVSYEEFLKIVEKSENRYELIDGELYYLASPLYPHQKAVKEIFGEFINWFRDKNCEPLVSPFDVTLVKSEKNICVVQPDILVICDRDKIDHEGKYNGVPSLVVEVLSESTSGKDNVAKLDLYMKTGVSEYWLVNTESKEIYIYVFKDKSIKHIFSFNQDKRAESMAFSGLVVELHRVFG